MQRDVLGQDRDAAFALQIVRVENAIALQLACAKLAALAEQASTSVVLPWSTWAMMAILRMSVRRMGKGIQGSGVGVKIQETLPPAITNGLRFRVGPQADTHNANNMIRQRATPPTNRLPKLAAIGRVRI